VARKHEHGFLTWKAPGKALHIRVYHDAIDRMTVDVMRGFGVTRRRGTEVGGVLLGKIDPAEPGLFIYDYEIVPCEYSLGPSYLLSQHDLEAFDAVVRRWRKDISPDQYAVGYFRSHTRDGLHLDEADRRVFQEHFSDPFAVALVVKPYATRSSEAGFFLQSDGQLETDASPLEFQFIRTDSALPKEAVRPPIRPAPLSSPEDDEEDDEEEERPVAVAVSPEPAAQAVVAPQQKPQAPTRAIPERPSTPMFGTYYGPREPSWRSRALWVVFTLAALGFGGAIGYEYAGGKLRPLLTGKETPPPPKPTSDPYNVQLSAVAQDQSVIVRWDRDSEAVKTARYAVLTITEGGASKEVKLDFPELRNGTVIYHRGGPEVSFRMDLYFKENRVFTETVTLQLPVQQ
jgi:hypothetical protein